MKKMMYFFGLALACKALAAESGDFCLKEERISAYRVSRVKAYQNLKSFDPGQHKTLMRIYNLPEGEEFSVKTCRPLMGQTDNEERIVLSRSCLYHTGELADTRKNGDVPTFVLTSRGHLPGEEITVILERKGQPLASQPLKFIPNPIILKSQQNDFSIEVRLLNVFPTLYEIAFRSEKREEISFLSNSFSEEIKTPFTVDKDSRLTYTPCVLGKEGGEAKIKIIRQTGEEMGFKLPWGNAFIPYLKGDKAPPVKKLPLAKSLE